MSAADFVPLTITTTIINIDFFSHTYCKVIHLLLNISRGITVKRDKNVTSISLLITTPKFPMWSHLCRFSSDTSADGGAGLSEKTSISRLAPAEGVEFRLRRSVKGWVLPWEGGSSVLIFNILHLYTKAHRSLLLTIFLPLNTTILGMRNTAETCVMPQKMT